METIKTTLYTYCYDVCEPEQLAAYEALKTKLKGLGYECFETHGGGSHYLGESAQRGVEVELETKHIFDNQWKTASTGGLPDRRVFDWAQDSRYGVYSPNIKRGHYLVFTPEMERVRRMTLKCGYCGAHYGEYHEAPPADGYCNKCLDSEYLEVKDLPLLRLFPVNEERNDRHGGADVSFLMARYKAAQIHGNTERGKARIAAQRAKLKTDYEKAMREAREEFEGFTWLMDKGINIENVIYYSHKNQFCFGWRKPVSPEVESELLDIISEFPFSYEIKGASGVKSA